MKNELVSTQQVSGIDDFCSIRSTTQEEKEALWIAIEEADKLDDYIGKQLKIQDVYVENIKITDKQKNEEFDAVRIVLVDEDGKGYGTISKGVANTLKRLFTMFGAPTWAPALSLTPIKEKGNNGFEFTTLTMAKKKK